MKIRSFLLGATAAVALLAAAPVAPSYASSHMDAPMITFDDAANTTDVYAFVSQEDGTEYLTTALSVYPFEEPGIGPNNYRFDDRVRYEIHVAIGDDVAEGEKTLTYRFDFETNFQNENTIRQAFLGLIDPQLDEEGFFVNQNMRQRYTVTKIDNRTGTETVLGTGIVPPNNQGQLTPFYNQNDDGDMPAKEGVVGSDETGALDPYTEQSISELNNGYLSFAGQREDGFYADIQAIFDLDAVPGQGFAFGQANVPPTPTKPFDSQGGFNVHTIVLNIPMDELEGETSAGVYATTSRRMPVAGNGADGNGNGNQDSGRFVQVGRQGNPLFVEALVAQRDKDEYNRTEPTEDEQFRVYAQDPDPQGDPDEGIEISRLLGVTPPVPGLVEFIFVPDVIKVDLTTGPARVPNDPNFNRLSGVPEVVGGNTEGADVLINAEEEIVFGGWPNGRRFGDDVIDLALLAVGTAPAFPNAPDGLDFDGVSENDITYNDVFPYAGTPLNGRNHPHHGEPNTP